jgi:hypothetical protein
LLVKLLIKGSRCFNPFLAIWVIPSLLIKFFCCSGRTIQPCTRATYVASPLHQQNPLNTSRPKRHYHRFTLHSKIATSFLTVQNPCSPFLHTRLQPLEETQEDLKAQTWLSQNSSPLLAFVTCMTSTPVEELISELELWLSLLATVRSSLQNQVSLLDSALSNLNLSQSSLLVTQNIHSVCKTIATQLSKVLREISDLELTRNLLTTQLSTGNYEYIFRLSDRQNNLTHRAEYYQELSALYDNIYNYL